MISLSISSLPGSCSSVPSTHTQAAFATSTALLKSIIHWLIILWPTHNYPLCYSSQRSSTSSQEYCNSRGGWLVLSRGNSPVRCPDLLFWSSHTLCKDLWRVCDCTPFNQRGPPDCSFPLHSLLPLLPCSIAAPSASPLGHSHLVSPTSPPAIRSSLWVLCTQHHSWLCRPLSVVFHSPLQWEAAFSMWRMLHGNILFCVVFRYANVNCARREPFGCFPVVFPSPLDGALGHRNSLLCCKGDQCSQRLQNWPLALGGLIIPELSPTAKLSSNRSLKKMLLFFFFLFFFFLRYRKDHPKFLSVKVKAC